MSKKSKTTYQQEVQAFVEKTKQLTEDGYELAFEPFAEIFLGDQISSFSHRRDGGLGKFGGNSMFDESETVINMPMGRGAVPWGDDNLTPIKVFRSAKGLPYSSAGLRYLVDLTCGMGVMFMYRYVKNAGGEYKERYIPFADAGVMLWDKVKSLRAQLKKEQEEGNPEPSAVGVVNLLNGGAEEEQDSVPQNIEDETGIDENLIGTIKEELRQAIKDYKEWERTNKEMEAFLTRNDINEHFHCCMTDNHTTDLYFSKIGLNQGKRDEWDAKVLTLDHLPVVVGRFEQKDEKLNINNVYHCEAWRKDGQMLSTEGAVMFPTLGQVTERYYHRDLVGQLDGYVRRNQKTRPRKRQLWWVVPISYTSTETEYYPQPHWWCLYTALVMTYANTLFFDKNAARLNATSFGKLIYINHNYFERIISQEGIKKPEEIKKKRDALIGTINNFLRNRANNGKTVTLDAYVDRDTKQLMKSVEIVDVPQPSLSTATSDDFNSIISIIAWAMGIHSSLLADKPGGSSSGTFHRELHLLKQNQMSPRQRSYIRHLEDIMRFNKWDKHACAVIKMPILTTLDNSKTGVVEEEVSI